MSYNRPSIIVTPSTPIPTAEPKLFGTQQLFSPSLSSHLAPPSEFEEEPSTIRRIQRRVQLIVAIIALFLSAVAFASIVHPSLISVPLANGLDRHHGLFSAVRVNFDDHELRSNEKRSLPLPLKQRIAEPTKPTWYKREWKLARMPAGSVTDIMPVVEEAEIPAENLTITTTDDTDDAGETTVDASSTDSTTTPPAQHVSSLENLRLKSTRAVQAQLMKEARARMDARKRRLGQRMKGKN